METQRIMMSKDFWYIWWFLKLSYVLAQEPVAILPQGRIVGIKVYTENSVTPVEIFFGIPYATPPIGRYRFSAPERHSGWRRTFFAHRIPPRCPHPDDGENDYVSEDCLFLNIWTPRRADGNSLPVVVVLYSETWERVGPTLPCQELAAEGVVVVTVAYRLHILSFFTLKSMSARGNLALLDQYLALLWVRDNIAAFGGDPTKITILGHSTGADSVLHHIASPRSVGLFQRAIVMSPRDIWKTIDKEFDLNFTETERISRELIRSLRCHSNADQEILQCMRARPLAEVLSAYSKANWSNTLQPVPDSFLPDTEQYLPMSLSAALSAGKQPMQLDLLLGTTDLEVVNQNSKDYEELLRHGATYVSDYANTKAIPRLLLMFSLHRSEVLPTLIQAVRWEYWGVKSRDSVERDGLEALARMESAARWGAGSALLAARLARRVARLYVYRYVQPGVDLQGRQLNFTGAVHGSDLVALLGDALMLQVARRPSSADEKRMSSTWRKYVSNFIKFGSPGVEDKWPPYRAGDAYVHEIRDEGSVSNSFHSASRDAAFWLQYLPQLSNLLTSTERTEQLTAGKGTWLKNYKKSTGSPDDNIYDIMACPRSYCIFEQQISSQHRETCENRLRGGVFALCGVSVVLLLLLFACALLLRRERAHRISITGDSRL